MMYGKWISCSSVNPWPIEEVHTFRCMFSELNTHGAEKTCEKTDTKRNGVCLVAVHLVVFGLNTPALDIREQRLAWSGLWGFRGSQLEMLDFDTTRKVLGLIRPALCWEHSVLPKRREYQKPIRATLAVKWVWLLLWLVSHWRSRLWEHHAASVLRKKNKSHMSISVKWEVAKISVGWHWRSYNSSVL